METREENPASLAELLNETRILLPGTEVFLAFLVTLPFTNRFETLDGAQRLVYLSTFFATLLALACFIAPAAYHRIARPIRDKPRFKAFASMFLVIGLAPISMAMILTTYLVTSVVVPAGAPYACAAIGLAIVTMWWLIPLLRAHDRFPKLEKTGTHRRSSWPNATRAATSTTNP